MSARIGSYKSLLGLSSFQLPTHLGTDVSVLLGGTSDCALAEVLIASCSNTKVIRHRGSSCDCVSGSSRALPISKSRAADNEMKKPQATVLPISRHESARMR